MTFSKIALITLISTFSLTSAANNLGTKHLSGAELLAEFNYNYPELENADNFIKMISHDKQTATKVFFSKNLPLNAFSKFIKGGDISAQFAVQCNDNEDEVCTTTTTKNDRVVEQSCKCVVRAPGEE